MNKKVLVISSSMRLGGNSDTLADEFIKGAKKNGHNVQKICLANKTIQFCKGCLACQETQHCIIKDDANDIIDQMISSDILVFSTPVYFYEMSGQLKTLLDRSNPAYPSEYSFRKIYLIATAADTSISALDGAIKGVQGWISCFSKASLADILYGVGLNDARDARSDTTLLSQSFAMGSSI